MDFNIVHLPKTGTESAIDLQYFGPLVFKTCLRQIVFLNSDSYADSDSYLSLKKAHPEVEIFNSENSYQFVLEVICGLRSLIKGETEIFGQFKEFFSANKAQIELMGMTALFKQLLTDCKALRSKRIQNWSQNTYGSVTRKLVNDTDSVALLGGGQLAQVIAPWLKHIKTKSVLLRRPKNLEPAFSGFRVEMTANLSYLKEITVLVVAAPIANRDLQSYLACWPNIRLVVDWRGDESLPGTSHCPVFHLRDLNRENERNKVEEAVRIQQVAIEIQTMALEFAKKAKHNPWGWEDFCA